MKRAKFSLSNYKLFSCDMGLLVPCGLLEVLPGDSIQQSTQALVRASPLLAPVMHPVHVTIRHFFVPHRLVWDDFEDFITGGPDGMNASVFPTVTLTGGAAGVASASIGQLADYQGVPPTTDGAKQRIVSALPQRGYQLIWNEFFRDQDLQSPANIATTSGNDTITVRNIQRVAWEKDYFTSARPWEQKGPAITIPLGNQAPISGLGVTPTSKAPDPSAVFKDSVSMSTTYAANVLATDSGNNRLGVRMKGAGSTAQPDVWADLSGASAVTVTVLREALALQRYEEARARFGSRYTEYLRYLGVRSSDARLQRPEYLGGGRQTIQFSEVLQTAEGTDPVGDLKGHGISGMRSNRYRRYFEEHGYIHSLMHIRPKTIYQSGAARHWNKRYKEDFWQKELQAIGQMEILNKEIRYDHATPEGIFGYQDRYDEYRRQESTVAGEFRDTTLNHWHMAREFATDPALNASFVTCSPTERIFASNTTHTMYIMAHHSIQARRLVAAQGKSFIY